ncbi:MAG: hypothetical protein JOZ52_07005, partial [Acidobacteria bacterium]|nr:hypothetical protein [Acidobacteriota bacterium]
HDLKNQLNGLKLYATFLRKRMEKSERPEDERETLAKLIAGIERAAGDMTALVRYSRPVELRTQPRVSLGQILSSITSEAGDRLRLELEETGIEGEYDASALTEALQSITSSALSMRLADEPVSIHLLRDSDEAEPRALIEWRNLHTNEEHDVFHSFAGSDGLRLSLAAKIIEAHQGEVQQQADMLRVRLPIKSSDK